MLLRWSGRSLFSRLEQLKREIVKTPWLQKLDLERVNRIAGWMELKT